MFLRRPLRRHSVFNHSTGTAGFPRSVWPQQQPRQTETWPITSRFVVREGEFFAISFGLLIENGVSTSMVYRPGYIIVSRRGHIWLTYFETKRRC